MTEQTKEDLRGALLRFVAPIVVGLASGYLASTTAIAVLEERVNKIEARQTIIQAQQTADGRSLTRIETKLDLLLTRSALGSK